MDRLNSQEAGSPATAKWANEVVDELRRLNIIPGNGLRKTVTSKGTVIDLDIPPEGIAAEADPAIDSCFPVFITSYYSGQVYKGVRYRIVGKDYGNGFFTKDEGENKRLYFPHVTPSSTVAVGSAILAHRIKAPIITSSND